MGRGKSQSAHASQVLYGPAVARSAQQMQAVVQVDGLQLPGRAARPNAEQLVAIIDALRFSYRKHDDSTTEMLDRLIAKLWQEARPGSIDNERLAENVRGEAIEERFNELREQDPNLSALELSLTQWDICMSALVRYAASLNKGQSKAREAAEEAHLDLSGIPISERGDSVLCSKGNHVISYKAVSGEVWRSDLDCYCGYICGDCL